MCAKTKDRGDVCDGQVGETARNCLSEASEPSDYCGFSGRSRDRLRFRSCVIRITFRRIRFVKKSILLQKSRNGFTCRGENAKFARKQCRRGRAAFYARPYFTRYYIIYERARLSSLSERTRVFE